MRLSIPYLVYHPEQTPNLSNVWCFSVKGVEAKKLVEDLINEIIPGQEVALPHPTDDCSRMVRRTDSNLSIRLVCHGQLSNPWREATSEDVILWLEPCAARMVRLGAPEGWIYWTPNEEPQPNITMESDT